MGLDILTPRGQQTLRDEERAASIWQFHNPEFRYCTTPKDSACSVDAVLMHHRDGDVRGLVECKCRYGITLDGFWGQFRGEWLVTMDKLCRGAAAAQMLCVPYYGFLYLVDSDVLLTRKIAESDGQFCVRFRCDTTATRKTVNGGEALRANAYIDMSQCREFEAPKPWTSTSSMASGIAKTRTKDG